MHYEARRVHSKTTYTAYPTGEAGEGDTQAQKTAQEESSEMTANEQKIIEYLRSLKPYERIEIVADKNGKLNSFLVHRSHKEILD